MTLLSRQLDRLSKRWGHHVSGWFSSFYDLEEKPGIFIVATQDSTTPVIIDVGESRNVRRFVETNNRHPLWRRKALGNIIYAVIYTEESGSQFLSEFYRKNIESHIRSLERLSIPEPALVF